MVNYDAFAETFSNSRKNLHWGELDAIIEDMRQYGYLDVLDVGCGSGRLLGSIQDHNLGIVSYLGIDNSIGMIGEARKLYPHYQFEICPMEYMSDDPTIRLSHYSAIIFLASFHHLETHKQRRDVLENIRKYLTPNGAIYMTNWNIREQSRYKKDHRGNGDYQIKIGEYSRYYHGFTIEELADLFHETGYHIVENRVFEGGRNIWSKIQI